MTSWSSAAVRPAARPHCKPASWVPASPSWSGAKHWAASASSPASFPVKSCATRPHARRAPGSGPFSVYRAVDKRILRCRICWPAFRRSCISRRRSSKTSSSNTPTSSWRAGNDRPGMIYQRSGILVLNAEFKRDRIARGPARVVQHVCCRVGGAAARALGIAQTYFLVHAVGRSRIVGRMVRIVAPLLRIEETDVAPAPQTSYQ